MKQISVLWIVLVCFSVASAYDTLKVTNFQIHPHDKSCYTQGLFFLN